MMDTRELHQIFRAMVIGSLAAAAAGALALVVVSLYAKARK